jgi:hypothetical protein
MTDRSKRQTQFSRTVQYFRTADLTEARAALGAAQEIVAARMDEPEVEPIRKRRRAVQAPAAELTQEALA